MRRDIPPERAIERYINERSDSVTTSTLRNHQYALRRFMEWFETAEPETLSDLDGFYIHEFKQTRSDSVSARTVYNNLSVLRTFLKWCEKRELVDDGLHEKIVMPDPERGTRKDRAIEPDTAQQILDYLEEYEPYTLRHACWSLIWVSSIRIGAAQGLDLSDLHLDGPDPYIEFHHRPESETPLKNGESSEREVSLHPWIRDVLRGYLESRHHIDLEDDYGRSPVFTTQHGRIAKTTLRTHLTALSRPCHYTNDCPHGREIAECEAGKFEHAARCPSSISPHDIRRSSLSAWLDKDHVTRDLLSERADVSPEILEEHYDSRSEERKRKSRRNVFISDFEEGE